MLWHFLKHWEQSVVYCYQFHLMHKYVGIYKPFDFVTSFLQKVHMQTFQWLHMSFLTGSKFIIVCPNLVTSNKLVQVLCSETSQPVLFFNYSNSFISNFKTIINLNSNTLLVLWCFIILEFDAGQLKLVLIDLRFLTFCLIHL